MNILIILSIIAFVGMLLLIAIRTKERDNYPRYGISPPYQKVIAVDFDGTLVESRFPDIGQLKKDVVQRVRQEKEKGNVIILWTCRDGECLEDAVKFLEENHVPIDYINENPLNPLGDSPRKIFADEYWDDRAVKII